MQTPQEDPVTMTFRSTRAATTALIITSVGVLGAVGLTGCVGAPGDGDGPTAPSASVPLDTATAPGTSPSSATPALSADPRFEQLEAAFGARLGVYAVDTGTGATLEYRGDERFAYASTAKALAAGVLLDQTTDAELDTLVRYDESDLLEYAPITRQHVASGMTLRELSDAAIRYSDNTAYNLMLERIGGPEVLDQALEAVGDDVTQIDRPEPDLNEATPGDPRDTTTPQAIATDLQRFVLGDALEPDDRQTLTAWLVGNTTGDNLIRAGAPDGWTIGDKTGAGGYGTRNDIAVLWPAEGEPIVLAVMSSRDTDDAKYDDALVAQAASVALDALGAAGR
jgi:beta-lactamase class A